MPWLLHDFCNVFKIDEKYMGLKKARKGAHRIEIAWNPVPKIPSKSEKFSVVRENINVVITRLKIKFEQVIITIKQLRSDNQIFAFKLMLVVNWLTCRRSKMSLCFPELRVETESGLMISGLQASSSIRSKRNKSDSLRNKITILTSRSMWKH